jgi:hypothetical protein
MRWPVALLVGLGVLGPTSGCRNCDLVEAELRGREHDVHELRADLARAESQNEALLRELQSLRQGMSSPLLPEQASQTYPLKQIILGRQTGGYDDDGCPGDEALQVALEPRDGDGHTIKAPGSLHVEALEVSPEGLKIPLSTWDLSPEQVRRSWRSGLLSTGYSVILPWKVWPTSTKLRVVARFTLADGRVFEADKDVTIRTTPVSYRKTSPSVEPHPAPGPALPEPETPLPSPQKLDPKAKTISNKAWWLPPDDASPPAQPGTKISSDVQPAVSTTAHKSPGVQPAAQWRPKQTPSLLESIQLLKPVPLSFQPGEDPEP